ncbi:MAG: hypothetical protein M9931_04410 [Chitinophagales bacterium]|nr:hypothetical protein [Chitinophagales bacterium]
MRKLVLGSLLGGLVATTANAQTVPNAGFENWKNDTSILNVNQSGIILTDTFSFEDPIDWTSVNYITGADTFEPGPGGVIMVTNLILPTLVLLPHKLKLKTLQFQ